MIYLKKLGIKKENETDFQAGNKWHICNKLHSAEDFLVML